jgi:hypothetical protein
MRIIKHLIQSFFLPKINFTQKNGNASQFWHVFQKSALFWNYTIQQTQTNIRTNINTETNENTRTITNTILKTG